MAIRALNTRYHDHRFRSRAEARWAVFMDSLGVSWCYENEGFDLGDGKYYLPDFDLREQNCWLEVKGPPPTPEEVNLAERLAAETDRMVFIFFGPMESQVPMDCWDPGGDSAYAVFPDGSVDQPYLWCECPECGRIGVTYEGRVDRLPCKCIEHKQRNWDSHRLMQAYRAAMSARFEFEDAA